MEIELASVNLSVCARVVISFVLDPKAYELVSVLQLPAWRMATIELPTQRRHPMDADVNNTWGFHPKDTEECRAAGVQVGMPIHCRAPHRQVMLLLPTKEAPNHLHPNPSSFQKDGFQSQARILHGGGTNCSCTNRRIPCNCLF